MGIGWIKGPCEPGGRGEGGCSGGGGGGCAHVATETDKVTRSRVALTERQNNSVITALASPRQLPPSPTHVRRSLPSPPSPLFIYSGFVVVSQPQVTVNR